MPARNAQMLIEGKASRRTALTHIKSRVKGRATLTPTTGEPMRSVLVFAVAAALAGGALAQSEQDHAAHHPEGASAPAAAAPKAPAKPVARAPAKAAAAAPAQMDMQMKSMQEMHEKMMAAKTPEERQALMAEHMKVMRDGMGMMGQMKAPGGKGANSPASPEMMGKRMDMMEMMMQMMMDREAARAPAGK
jgi:hypothetical protein